MIPKIIHYIWLGGNEMPDKVKECIESWKRFCPDYEIKRWDESNLNLDCNTYCREAYDMQKYAFASDVLRFKVLCENGGIYLDIDVMLYKNLDDLLYNKVFTGFESNEFVAPGLILGAEKNNIHIKNLYDYYKDKRFVNKDGSFDYTTICDITTKYLIERGLKTDNSFQTIDGFSVYPVDYFCPLNYKTKKINKTENTYSIHLYLASWVPSKTFVQKFKTGVKGVFSKILKFLLGPVNYEKLKTKHKERKNGKK